MVTVIRNNAVQGALNSAVTDSDTTFNSDGFQDLEEISGDEIAKIALWEQDAKGRITKYEIVYVTSHSVGSKDATVERGKEGTNGQAWDKNSKWRHVLTAQDVDNALKTTPLIVPASQFKGLNGSPSYDVPGSANSGELAVWHMASGVDNSIAVDVMIPNKVTSIDLKLRWMKLGTNDNDVVLLGKAQHGSVGSDGSASGSDIVASGSSQTISVSGSQYQIQETSLGAGVSVTPQELYHVELTRNGTNSSDNLSDAWGIYALVVTES